MYIGFIVGSMSFVFGVYIIVKRILGGTIEPWASLMVAILFLSGLQLFFIGVIGDYLGRVYDEVRDRPLYIVDDIINFNKIDKPGAKTTEREAKEIAIDNKDV